jgi:hypothetical protein
MEIDLSTHMIEIVNSFRIMIIDKDCNHIKFSCQMINNRQSLVLVEEGMFLHVQFSE